MKPTRLYSFMVIGLLGAASETWAGSYGAVDGGAPRHVDVAVAGPGSIGPAAVAMSSQARRVVALALAGDAAGKPFMVVDKRQAHIFIFNGAGEMVGSVPALLGSAIGDDSAPGVGSLPLARISPAERTTPAGRFAASFGENSHGEPVLWVDYDAAIALHSVARTNPKEQRVRRLGDGVAARQAGILRVHQRLRQDLRWAGHEGILETPGNRLRSPRSPIARGGLRRPRRAPTPLRSRSAAVTRGDVGPPHRPDPEP